jgi:CDP-diacylglycerol--glycerol-3-phosphate 3-phosphatidyltransferase
MITAVRIIGAFLLPFTKPLSAIFFTIYFLCCLSDILDGAVARKTNTTSKLGEVLDSVADLVLIAVMLVIFIPLLSWQQWMLYWIIAIAGVRFLSLTVGFVKYKAFSFLHTYANKATGIALAFFPILHWALGLSATVFILCGTASLSALEELAITISSGQLNRNRRSLFS